MQRLTTAFSTALLLATAGLAGCNLHECGAAETGPAPLGLVFSTDTLGTGLGYRKNEAFSAYLVRYRGADFSQPLDTLRARDKAPVAFFYVDRKLFCNFTAAAGPTGPQSYRLEVPATRQRFDLTDIRLEYGGVDNCTRTITRLDVLLNGQRTDARQGVVLSK